MNVSRQRLREDRSWGLIKEQVLQNILRTAKWNIYLENVVSWNVITAKVY